ncbi:MAG: S8 family serine peptidase [Flavobacteriales bacterium]
MTFRGLALSSIFTTCCLLTFSQEKFWVFLRDKHGCTFDAYTYFEPKAIERRLREGLSLQDSTDFPLNENYVAQIELLCDSVSGTSRWFNAVACVAHSGQLQKIKTLPFVRDVQCMLYSPDFASLNMEEQYELSDEEMNVLKGQTEVMQYDLLRNKGYNGSGVVVAVFDAGFDQFLNDEAFRGMIADDRIVATYDFVKEKKFVFHGHSHGTHVVSCIGGVVDSMYVGCATGAKFLLARTEQAIWESRIEEEHWVMSAEWADKWGADIINSSLGYTNQFYFSRDMDGVKSMISRAATMAAHKGILVCNSAGNEAVKRWQVIGAPADADSILTIGGVEPITCLHASFSSYGPTADMRMKPNLCAFGHAMARQNNEYHVSTGTSFSSPLVAGFAACIKQMHPEWTLKQLYDEMQHSGHLYPYFDYAHGYGIPQASYFVRSDEDTVHTDTVEVEIEYKRELDMFQLRIASADTASIARMLSMEYLFEEEPDEFVAGTDPVDIWQQLDYEGMKNYLYWHVENAEGVLTHYEIVWPEPSRVIAVRDTYPAGSVLRVHWLGKTYEWKLEEQRKP